MPKKRKKKSDTLDTTTTFANMNVEGFKWYDPSLEKREADKMKGVPPKISRREYWQIVRGAFVAALPVFGIIILIFGLIVGFAYLWLS